MARPAIEHTICSSRGAILEWILRRTLERILREIQGWLSGKIPGVVLDAAMDEIRGRFSRKNLGNFSCIISELNMERILKVPLGKIPVKIFTEFLTKIWGIWNEKLRRIPKGFYIQTPEGILRGIHESNIGVPWWYSWRNSSKNPRRNSVNNLRRNPWSAPGKYLEKFLKEFRQQILNESRK